MIFEFSVILISAVFLLILFKVNKNVLKVYGLTFLAVLLFEYFTQSLWLNNNLEPWAYLYLSVSWVITLGWTTIIVVSREISALYLKKASEKIKLFFDIVIITIIGFFAEWVVLRLNIREYSEASKAILSGTNIGLVPIEAVYYIPVFMILVVAFSLYWEKQLLHKQDSMNITEKQTK